MKICLTNLLIICLSISVAIGQGTIGQYPGNGVGFDSGCGYLNAGVSNPATMDNILANCGTTVGMNTGPLFETATGFDLSFELSGIEANEASIYGIRLFYGPQNMCCTLCLDAIINLGQGTPCGQIPPVPDLTSFPSPETNIPFPTAVINYGELVFGEDIIPYENMCPNTEYFVDYQTLTGSSDDVSDPDGNNCALDDATIISFGSMSFGTIVAPGTRDPLEITTAAFALETGESCQSPVVELELTAEILAGCSAAGEVRLCSQGMELEFRNPSAACLDALVTGPIIDDPTACLTGIAGLPFTTVVSLGNGQAVCDLIAACGGTGTIELYAVHTFCASDDISAAADGSGNDEAVIVIDVLSALSGFNCANCPGVCEIMPDPATNIVCNDNGTPADPSDDTFTFDITVNGSNTNPGVSNAFMDDQGNTTIAYGTTVSYGPFPISGGAVTVNFTDTDDDMCTAMMMAAAPATCSGAVCTITPDAAANIVCNDNGTPGDPSDDTFTFDITVNGSSTFPGATNTFTDDQGNAGIAYGTTVSYGPFPISGGNATVMFTDAEEAACTGMMMAAAPATCSGAECTITPDAAANIVCDDNGTPGDSSDDTFTFDITVNGSSTFPGSTNTFNDDQGNAGIAYGTTVSYGPFPISGGNATVMFTDADEATCTGMMMATAPATCSGSMCTITPDAAANIVCNDNGTPADSSDDTFTFDITVNGSSTFPGATNTFNDDQGNAGIAYGTTVSYGPFPISGGNATVMFTDADEATCTGMMMATAPATCSGSTCTITPDAAANIVCDDNGTPDPSDDTFTFDITVNGSSTFPGATNTFNDDQGNAGIAYGTTLSYGPFPISGGNVTVMFTDTDEATCTGMMMATAPATCSEPTCTITPDAAANIICDDNGTPEDPSDDTFTFDITVNGGSTFPGATNTFNDDQGNAGIAYGTAVSYGPFPISGGNIIVTYTDAEEASCTGMMMAAAPATCSAGPCEGTIGGIVISEEVGCSVEGIEVTIYDATGAVVAVVLTDATGFFVLPDTYPCGSYSAELTASVPDCFTGSGGMTGPIDFNVGSEPGGFGDLGGAAIFTEVGEVPTLSQWGLMILALLMMTFGALKIGSVTLRTAKSRNNF